MAVHDWLRSVWEREDRIRYVAVGIGNTLVGYGVYAGLIALFGRRIGYLAILVVAHFIGVANAFVWHRRVTFRSVSAWGGEFLRFNVSYLGTLTFGLIAVPICVQGFGLSALQAGALVTVVSVLGSYLLHKRYSFQRSSNDDSSLRRRTRPGTRPGSGDGVSERQNE